MKRFLALLLLVSLVVSGCASGNKTTKNEKKEIQLNDSKQIEALEDQVYKQAIESIGDGYVVDKVDAVYIPEEYIEELEYNSKENDYFGYKISKLNKKYKNCNFVFTVGDKGNTVVKKFEAYDDTMDNIIRDVAIGSGVILVCVVITAVSGGVGAPAVASVFAIAAKGATSFAISSAVIDGSLSGITTAMKTNGNIDAVKKSFAKNAAKGFKWGAITGAVTAGTGKFLSLKSMTKGGLKIGQVAKIQKETKWSRETISSIRSMDEYRLFKGAKEMTINGKRVLVTTKVYPRFQSTLHGKIVTNAQRMEKGYSPLNPKTGKEIELHHIGQENDSTLAMMTSEKHNKYSKILHDNRRVSSIDRTKFKVVRKKIWKAYVKIVKK